MLTFEQSRLEQIIEFGMKTQILYKPFFTRVASDCLPESVMDILIKMI